MNSDDGWVEEGPNSFTSAMRGINGEVVSVIDFYQLYVDRLLPKGIGTQKTNQPSKQKKLCELAKLSHYNGQNVYALPKFIC